MKKISVSRNKLLTTAQSLILRRGFSATTIDALCIEAEVTKGSFFHHFSGKEALAEAVLVMFWDEVRVRQEKANYQRASDPLSKMLGYIDHTIDTYGDPRIRRGCLLAIYILELKETYPLIYSQTVKNIQHWRDDLHSMLNSLHKTQQSSQHFNPLDWTDLFISTLEGSLILAQSLDDVTVVRKTLSLYKSQLQTCFS
jgi:TetR/AcrR family transcriptional regulator, transcriptional repressor for nem operon